MQVGEGSAGEVKSDINVTPLVDVCLVLLIIFMVVTPMLQKGDRTLTLSINKKKEIFIEREQVPKENLLAAMREIHDRSSEKTIYLKADKFLKYGDVKEVMVICNEAGFERVGLITEPKSEAETKAQKK